MLTTLLMAVTKVLQVTCDLISSLTRMPVQEHNYFSNGRQGLGREVVDQFVKEGVVAHTIAQGHLCSSNYEEVSQ